MRRSEALIGLAASALLAVAGLTWLFGPYALIASGVALLVFVFSIQIRE